MSPMSLFFAGLALGLAMLGVGLTPRRRICGCQHTRETWYCDQRCRAGVRP